MQETPDNNLSIYVIICQDYINDLFLWLASKVFYGNYSKYVAKWKYKTSYMYVIKTI